MIYGLEPFDEIQDELEGLLVAGWEEVDQRNSFCDLDPNYELYVHLTNKGMYLPYTIRTDEGELVGYMGLFLQNSMHCAELEASTDYMYIKKQYRGLGAKLIRLIEEDLKERGVKTVSFVVKASLDNGGLADKLGFTLQEKVYQKRL